MLLPLISKEASVDTMKDLGEEIVIEKKEKNEEVIGDEEKNKS